MPLDEADRQGVAEEAERVDVEDPVRPTGQVGAEELIAVRRHGQEELEEEERHDGEVVACETARRQAEQESDDGPDDDYGRDGEDGRQMDAVLLGAEERIGIRADAVERDVAEVEQAAPADDDVQPEREQHVERDVERHSAHVSAVVCDRKQSDEGDERGQPGPPGNSLKALLDHTEAAAASGEVSPVPRDPLVLSDRGAGRALRLGRLLRSLERPGQLVVVAAHLTPS